jgi:hypothetical protein
MSYPTMDDYEELWALHFAAEDETHIEARRIDRPTNRYRDIHLNDMYVLCQALILIGQELNGIRIRMK